MSFTIRNGITGARVGKLYTDQTKAEQSASDLSVERRQSFDVIRHDGAFDTYGQPVSFASCGTIYSQGV